MDFRSSNAEVQRVQSDIIHPVLPFEAKTVKGTLNLLGEFMPSHVDFTQSRGSLREKRSTQTLDNGPPLDHTHAPQKDDQE